LGEKPHHSYEANKKKAKRGKKKGWGTAWFKKTFLAGMTLQQEKKGARQCMASKQA
jgi:hypothetical protein